MRMFLLSLARARPVSNRPALMVHSYNQTRGDFATDRDYNDYLEEVEDMSASFFSLTFGAENTV